MAAEDGGGLKLKTAIHDNRVLLTVLFVLAVASAVRFGGINVQSLSNDELSSWRQSSLPGLSSVIVDGARQDVHPPGYQVFLYFMIRIFGDSQTALRAPSAIFGVLSVLFMFLVGKRIFTAREGLISASIMGVLWCPIFYSQDVRPYSMMLFFSLLSIYLMIDIIKTIRHRGRLGISLLARYLLSASILSYTHYFGLYLAVLQCITIIFAAILSQSNVVRAISSATVLAVLYVPWIPTLLEHMGRGPIWIDKPSGNFLAEATSVLEFFSDESPWMMRAAAFLIILLVIHMYAEWYSDRSGKRLKKIIVSGEGALFLWLLIPFIGVYIKSMKSVPVLSDRNMIISLPPAILITARSLERLPIKPIARNVIASLIPLFLLFHLVFVKDYYVLPRKDQFREIVNFAIAHHDPETASLIIGEAYSKEYLDYYFEKSGSPLRLDLLVRSDWDTLRQKINDEKPEQIIFLNAGKKDTRTRMMIASMGYKESDHKRYFNRGYSGIYLNETSLRYRRRQGTGMADDPLKHTSMKENDRPTEKELWELGCNAIEPMEKIAYFERLAREYGDSKYAPQAIYLIGFTYSEELGDTTNAKRFFEQIIQKYPDDEIAKSARWMIENMNFQPVFTE